MRAYHFTGETLRDGRPIPPIGEPLVHKGRIVPCESGLHASEHPFDALTYAPGNLLHRVSLEGDLVPHGDPTDKWVGRRRTILATLDARELLLEYARWCALQVIHLWDAPQVVRDYLETGDKPLAKDARDVAWVVVRDATNVARVARDAANSASAAAWAARSAAWAAARAAAWAARSAAKEARAAAKEARSAARAVAWEAQRDKFLELVEEAKL